MSKNTDTQNLLVNVFRPVYTYETPAGESTPVFKSKIILTNIDTVYANTISATNYQVGDSNNNLYLGCNAGNTADNPNACANVVGIGASAASNVSNVSNSTYLGTAAGAGATNASNVIAIGTSTNGNGVNNIYIGNASGNIGSNNIFLGHSNAPSGTVNNTLRIGKTLIGDLSANKLGIGTSPTYELDVSGTTRVSSNVTVGMTPCNVHALDVSGYSYFKGAIGINADPLDHTLSVNGDLFVSDGNARYYFNQDASQNSVFVVESLDPTKKAVFVIHGDISADNIVFNTETYSNLTITGTMKSADISAVDLRVQNLVATTFTAGTFGATDLSAGTLTATRVNAISDISAGAINTANLTIGFANITDISATTGRFTTIYADDICANTTVVVPNINVTGDISATGNLYGLGFIGTDISATTASIGTVYTNPNTANLVGGVTLSNTNLTLSGTITGNTVNTSNVIGGVVLSNNNVSNSGTHTSSNFIGTSSASNSIGGVTLSNTNISLNGTITGNTANTSNVIGGVVLSNNNLSNSGTHTTVNVISSGYLRNALTPTTWDISGGNISNSGTTTSSNFIGTASASNSVGGVTLSNSNVSTTNILASGYVRNALTPSQFDISGGNLFVQSNVRAGSMTITGDVSTNGTFFGNYVATSVTSSNLVVSGYLRNALTPSQFDISGGNISNSATTRSSNFIGTASASNQIGGVTLSNSNVSLAGTITGSTANTSNVIGGVVLSNNNVSNSGTTTSSNFIGTASASNSVGGIVLSNANIRVGLPASTVRQAYTEIGGGYGAGGTAAARSFPAITFQYGDAVVGGYRHFIRTRHDTGALSSNNAVDIFTNNGANPEDASGSTLNTRLAMSVTSAGVGVGTDLPGFNLDVSGNIRSTATSSNNIGGVTLSNSNVSTTNALVSGYLRNALTPTTWDISGGNISNSGTHITPNVISSGYLRNALTPTTWDISGGNISNSGTTRSSNFIGTASASNSIGGTLLSNGIVGIGTSTPAYTLDVSGNFRATTSLRAQGGGTGYVTASIAGGGSYGGIDMNGYFIQYRAGTASNVEANKLVQFPSDTGLTNYFMTNRVGVGTVVAAYQLDVSAGTTAASINMTSWPRVPMSNVCILKNGTGYVGNTVNWASSVQSINTNLATVVSSNATNGCSFVINRAGIWSISYALNSATSGVYTWVDASSNNNSNVAFNTAGTYPIGSVAQTSLGFVQYTWTGYLPSNANFYKVRASATTTSANNPMYFMLSFLGETDSNLTFPY